MRQRKKQKVNANNEVHDETKEAKYLMNEGKTLLEKAVCEEEYREAIEMFSKAIGKSLNVQVMHLNHLYHYRGQCYFQLKEFELAEKDFQEAISISDDKSKIQFYNSLGKCKVEMSIYDPTYLEQAIKCFERSLEFSNGIDGEAYFNLGGIYRKIKKNFQAIKEYTNAIKYLKQHQQYQVYINRGLCYREIGQIDNSIDDIAKACEICKDNPTPQFHLGINYLLSFNYQVALEKFNLAIEMDQLEPQFQNYKGLALYMSEQYEQCLGVFRQALKLYGLRNVNNAEVGECWYNTGNALLNLVKQDEALNSFEKALQYDIDNQLRLKIFYSEGRAYENLGMEAAIRKFQQCLSLINQNKANDLYLSALYHLGKNQHKFKLLSEAIKSYGQILASDCNDKCVYQSRGLAYLDDEKYELALKDFQMVASFDENYPEVYFLIGLSKTHLGDIENAIQDFFHSVELGSRNMAVFNGISYAYLKNGKYEKALIYSNISLQKEPKNQQFLIQRSRIYIALDENSRGIEDLSLALQVNDKNAVIYYRRGLAFYKNKEYQLAIQDLQRSLMRNPSNHIEPDTHYHLGISYANLEHFQLAIEPFTRAIQKQEMAKYYHERAKCYLLLDQNKEALRDLNEVISLQNSNAFAYFRRALAHKALKNYEEAAQDFARAREISPSDPRLIINKKQIYQMKYRKLCEPGEEE